MSPKEKVFNVQVNESDVDLIVGAITDRLRKIGERYNANGRSYQDDEQISSLRDLAEQLGKDVDVRMDGSDAFKITVTDRKSITLSGRMLDTIRENCAAAQELLAPVDGSLLFESFKVLLDRDGDVLPKIRAIDSVILVLGALANRTYNGNAIAQARALVETFAVIKTRITPPSSGVNLTTDDDYEEAFSHRP